MKKVIDGGELSIGMIEENGPTVLTVIVPAFSVLFHICQIRDLHLPLNSNMGILF